MVYVGNVVGTDVWGICLYIYVGVNVGLDIGVDDTDLDVGKRVA